jgi:hypothetical protein
MLTDTLPHVKARGSNDLIGKNVVQTMTWMTPDEYEKLQALNAWTGRSDLVGLRYIDEFNQTAGRNLGFRRRGDESLPGSSRNKPPQPRGRAHEAGEVLPAHGQSSPLNPRERRIAVPTAIREGGLDLSSLWTTN